MSNDGMSLRYLGLDLTAASETIETAIAQKKVQVRRQIARGEVDGQKATAEFAKHCAGARRWMQAQIAFKTRQMTTAPSSEPPPLTLIACQACTLKVSPAATACPHCGHPVNAFVQATPTKATTAETKPKTSNTATVVFFFIGAAVLLTMCSQTTPLTSTQNNSGYWYGAKSACHDAVRERLKAPSSASFGPIDEYGHNITNEVREIRGSVDSQNSFGAMLRNQYTCSISGRSVTSVDIR